MVRRGCDRLGYRKSRHLRLQGAGISVLHDERSTVADFGKSH